MGLIFSTSYIQAVLIADLAMFKYSQNKFFSPEVPSQKDFQLRPTKGNLVLICSNIEGLTTVVSKKGHSYASD